MRSQLNTAKDIVSRGIFDDVQSFSDLEERISALGQENTKIVGDAFEIFIEAYLATQPKHQMEANWVVGKVPLPVREELNLPNDSKGIDGVFRTRSGTLVPYQVKFRSKRAFLTYTEVAPFLGLTERAADRVIFTNSNEVALDAKNRDAMRTVRGIDFDDLTPEDFRAIESWLKEKSTPVKKRPPLPHQAEGIEKICGTLADHDRATAVMACGTGKTMLALWVAERLEPKTVLVLLPSLTLVQQTLDEWARHNSWGERFSFIAVCSDKTVAGSDAIELDKMDVEFPVSTNPAEVRSFLEGASDRVKILFATYQSSKIISEALEGLDPFDFAIFDEAHKTTGPRGGLFAHALSDDNLPVRKRLFLTATPRHYDIRKKDREGDFKVVSMDDDSVYGPRAYTLTFGEAARRGLVCDYKVVISVVDGADITRCALEHGMTLIDGDEISAKWVANQLAIERAITETGASRAITFHSRVNLAQEFASETPRGVTQFLEDFCVCHVNGKQTSSERKQLLKDFRDAPKALITNARCLTEGVDIPAVDMVAFVDPRRSKVDIAQATGRTMRKPFGSDKEVGYVVVPLFLEREAGETFEETIEQTDFADVAAVLNAMQEQDEDLVEIIRELKEAKGRGTTFNPAMLREKFLVLGPALEIDALTRSIAVRVVDSIGAPWSEWFGNLLAYVDEFGDCLVPANYRTGENKNLGSWVLAQRAAYRRGELSNERQRRLEDVGFVWNTKRAVWLENYNRAKAFYEANGHCIIPSKGPTYQLGRWQDKQRARRNYIGEEDSLDAEQIRLLQDIEFPFDLTQSKVDHVCRLLRKYLKMNGHTRVSKNDENSELARYVFSYRAMIQNKFHPFTEAQVNQLVEAGLILDPIKETWLATRGEILAKLETGAALSRNELNLARKGLQNRFGDERDLLNQELEAMLKARNLAVVKEALADVAAAHLATLQNAKSGKQESQLAAAWVKQKRSDAKRGRLSAEDIEVLKMLKFPFDAHNEILWKKQLESFLTYVERGTPLVKQEIGEPLYNWKIQQRMKQRRGSFKEWQLTHFDEMGVDPAVLFS